MQTTCPPRGEHPSSARCGHRADIERFRMKRVMMWTTAALLLAVGCGARKEADKETAIDWPARAATVRVGMTRAEVEKILPEWKPPPSVSLFGRTWTGHTTGGGWWRHETYFVAESWRVTVCFDYACTDTTKESANGKRTKRWTIDQRVGIPRDDASQFDPHNRLLEPVKIEKVEKPISAIDWPARAATVKVGMTPAEVEKILPKWVAPQDLQERDPATTRSSGPYVLGSAHTGIGFDQYRVAEDWLVNAAYSYSALDGREKMRLTSLGINKITGPSDDRKVWAEKAASIKVGMTRAEAESKLPAWALVQYQTGRRPKADASREGYWFAEDWLRRYKGSGATWALTIDYDGVGSAENRVIKLVKIEVFEKPYPKIPHEKLLLRTPKP